MPRDRKKLKKAIDNRFKQMKFAKKYGNFLDILYKISYILDAFVYRCTCTK